MKWHHQTKHGTNYYAAKHGKCSALIRRVAGGWDYTVWRDNEHIASGVMRLLRKAKQVAWEKICYDIGSE